MRLIHSILALTALFVAPAWADNDSWAHTLADPTVSHGEAEFSISYPGEQGGAVQTFTVASLGGGRFKAWAHSSRRAVRTKDLSKAHYEELLTGLRELDFTSFEKEGLGACEKFTLKIKAASREGRFEGCREGNANASKISRLAHRTEFLLLSAPGR
jgi:hypothetical protein